MNHQGTNTMSTTIKLPAVPQKPANVIKVRDDHRPLYFSADGEKFKLQEGSEASWISDGQEFGQRSFVSGSSLG